MRRLSLTVIAAFVVALSGLFTGTAFADGGCPSDMPCNSPNTVPPDPGGYSGAAAAAYADKYALGANPAYPDLSANGGGGDCTNFVSQAMLAGGWVMTGTATQTDDTYWHFIRTSSTTGSYTRTWSAANNLWRYEAYTPYSVFEGKWNPGSASWLTAFTPGPVKSGDVILYNWYNDDNSSTASTHWSMQTGYGTTQNGQPPLNIYGNYVDEHTTNRYHVFWSLYPYNTKRATTSYRFWHMT